MSTQIDTSRDFHTLSSSEVEQVLAEADRQKYRKPKNASGSRARYFYQKLQREAARGRGKGGKSRNPSGTRYRGVITAIPGHFLLGGGKKHVSAWFATKSDAAKWIRTVESSQPEAVATHFIERGKGRIDIGPGASWVRKGNPSGGPLDTTAARELELFVENDGDLHRRQGAPINKNLITKMARGVYNHAGAVKLFGYLMESGAKKYVKEFGSPGDSWHQMFSPATRKAAAERFADHFEVEAKLGNYDHLLPKKYSGWRLKSNPGRLTDVLVKRGGQVFKAKAKYDPKLGRVRVFVNPRVAGKMNPVGPHYPYDAPTFTANFFKKADAEKAQRQYIAKGYATRIRKVGKTYELLVYGNPK